MKKQSGITLIALVITIVVLLILAGVSISLVIGDNGILTQATDAVIENRKASVAEDVSMAWAALETEYIKDWTSNTSTKKSQYFNVEKFTEKLASKGIITADTFNFDSNTEVITFKYKANSDEGKEYQVAIDNKGKVILDGWATTITVTNYGDYVDYPVDINGDGKTEKDWKIFYSNGANAFLIASEYVDKTLVKSGMCQVSDSSYPYGVNWNGTYVTKTELRKDTLFGITKDSYILNLGNSNSKCISTMLNTANWTDFKDQDGYGIYVVGGPTIEMWVASWNAKGEKYNTIEETKYEILETDGGAYGYRIGLEGTDLGNAYTLITNSEKGWNDKLYFPYQAVKEGCYGYWLASPSNNGPDYMLRVKCDSDNLASNRGGSVYYGVRPVVCLNPVVDAEWDEANQIWELK